MVRAVFDDERVPPAPTNRNCLLALAGATARIRAAVFAQPDQLPFSVQRDEQLAGLDSGRPRSGARPADTTGGVVARDLAGRHPRECSVERRAGAGGRLSRARVLAI